MPKIATLKKVLILLFSFLLINVSRAAFPVQGISPSTHLELLDSGTNSVDNIAPAASVQNGPPSKTRSVRSVLNTLDKRWKRTQDRSWMGPLSFFLMFVPFGFLVGIPMAIITRIERYRNRGWALATLLLIPAAILIGTFVVMVMA